LVKWWIKMVRIFRIRCWKEGLESKGLRVNMSKTKVYVL